MLENNIIAKLENFAQNAEQHNWIELSLVTDLITKYVAKLSSIHYKITGVFSENNFDLEIKTTSSEILFIDLSLTFLDIRFNYFENNFFIDEVEIEDIEKYFEFFFNGDYEIISFYDEKSKKVYKNHIIWKSADMSRYNTEYTYNSIKDLFIKEKVLKEIRKEGYKWKLTHNY